MKNDGAFWQHLLAFNSFWFLSVSFGNAVAWPLVVLYGVAFRSALKTVWKRIDISVALIATIAMVIDVVLHACEIITFSYAPAWLLPLWAVFLVSFAPLYSGLKNVRWWLGAMLGAGFGPLSYYAGSALKAVTISHPLVYLVWSLLWALVFVVLIRRLLQEPEEVESC